MGSKSVQIQTPDGVADAFVAFPEGDGEFPAVLFLMDGIGSRAVLRDMARTISDDGFYVLLPNLFYRAGPAPLFELGDMHTEAGRDAVMAKVMPLIRALTPELAMSDVTAYLDFLDEQPEVAGGPVGVTGYCMGGRLALQAASAFPARIAAMASFHGGRLATDSPDSPHREAGNITAELYFAHAEDDASMTPEQVHKLEEALDGAGVAYRSEVYPGTQHGFTMSDTVVYDPNGLERHWRNLLELFERTLPRPAR